MGRLKGKGGCISHRCEEGFINYSSQHCFMQLQSLIKYSYAWNLLLCCCHEAVNIPLHSFAKTVISLLVMHFILFDE